MINNRIFALTALAVGSVCSAHADPQTIQGKFRGMYVCAKLPTTHDVLRAPLDLVVEGNSVRFARPLFNLDGTRVLGSEMASGTIDGDGKLHLSSDWSYLGVRARGDYSGTLTPTGGTLTGTQTWNGPEGTPPVNRACTAALVPAADVNYSAEDKPKQ
jgi:hypothetical protein